MSSSALSQVFLPFRFAMPYSVTTKLVAVLGVVTILPSGSIGLISETLVPSLSVLVDGVHRKLLPPFDAYAPRTKSSYPPVPEICCVPAVSEQT